MSAVAHRSFSRVIGWLLATLLVLTGSLIAAPAARADENLGALSGTVTDEVGNPVRDVNVIAFAYDVPGHEGSGRGAATGDDGTYTIDQLPAGIYKVVFETESSSPSVVSEWWLDAADQDSATLVAVGTGTTTTDISPQLSLAGAFAGTVTDDDGNPVESVGVTVYGYDDVTESFVFRGITYSSVDGTFVVGGVPGGDYKIRFTTDGASADVAGEWWDDAASESSATIVPLTGGVTVWGISPRLSPAPVPPLESSVPTISGTPRFGEVLTAEPGSWAEGAEFEYQWFADGDAIDGATAASLTLSAAEVGKQIAVVVVGSKEGYQPVAIPSVPTERVAPIMLTAAMPVISGTVAVGSTVTANPGSWTEGTAFSYQWFADGVALAGATEPTFVITAAQLGKKLTVRVAGALTSYASVAVLSAATAAVPLPVLAASVPTISGAVASGSTLTANPGAWTSGAAFAYQWYANGVAIKGATKPTLKLAAAQKAKTITVKVTGSKTGFVSVAKTSAKSGKVATAGTPTISGTKTVGKTLTANRGTWTSGTSFSYQWYANGVAVKGATKSTLKLTKSHKGKTITVKVTGKKSGYATVAKVSKATAKVK